MAAPTDNIPETVVNLIDGITGAFIYSTKLDRTIQYTGLFTSRPMGDGKGKTASTTVEQGRLIPKMDRTIQRKQFGTCQIWRQ